MLFSDPDLDVDTILAIEEQLAVPEHIERDYLVSPEISVHALVNTVLLPTPTYDTLITPNSDAVFSSHGPKEDPARTFSSITYSLPPRAFVIDVHTKARQKVLDGWQSVHDPYHRDALYPVWIITYWKQMYDVLEKRDQWREGLEWLAKKKADGIKGAGEALQHCLQLPWDTELDALPGGELGASAHMLARLLGNRWLSTELVDLMLAQINLQSKNCQTHRPIILERSRFINALERRRQNTTTLSRIESTVRENLSKCHLYFVVHHRSHFVAVRVRFDKRRIEYGDSLVGYPAPKEALEEVKAWAETQFGGTYTVHDTLPHGIQDDECSCGLLAVNAIAHNVLGESLWCSADTVLARVEWFNRICTAYHAMARGRAPQKTDGSVPTIEHEACGVDADDGPSVSGRMSIAGLLNPENHSETSRIEAADGGEEKEGDEDGGQDQDAVINEITPLDTGGPADSSLTTALVSSVPLETPASSALIAPIFLPRPKRPQEDVPALSKLAKKSRRTEPSPPRKANREIVESSSNVGISKSARRQKEGRAQARDGRLPDKPHLTAKFKKKLADAILFAVSQGASEPSKDPYACFEIVNMCAVRHVKCGVEVQLSGPRELRYWKAHVDKPCDGPKKSSAAAQSSGMRRLSNYFLPAPPLAPSSKAATPSAPSLDPSPSTLSSNAAKPSVPWSDPPSRLRTGIALPCLGLTAGLERYLLRPIAGGGGARDVNSYSDELYQKPFADLTSRRKDIIRRKQKLAWLWTTDVNNKTVYHRDCTGIAVPSTTPAPASAHWPLGARRNGTCSVCCSLWDEPSFRRVVRKPVPSDSNIKFANKQYVDGHIVHMYSLAHGLQDLMESKFSPFLRYLQLVLANKVPQDDMFALMLKCLVIKIDKLERGKGLRNFKYPPNLVQLSMNVASKSPAAYTMLSEHVQLPELRTLRSHEAKEPRLPIGIAPDGAQLAKEHLIKVGYTGPVSFSVDDTACKESADVYRCSRRNAFFCLGLDGEEIHVPDPTALRSIIASSASLKGTKGKKGKKATKIRAFVIRATGVPSLPSILVAAAAISNPDAEELVEYSWSILHFLWERGINVVSYACDGASVERKVQTLLKARASYLKTYTLPHPGPSCPDIKITVAHYGENALAFIQDAKHALKTARNNAYSGARVLSLPNHVVTLPQLWQIYSEGGPFYSRDVNRPDRQDDNAAGRFAGGDALAWVVENHPEYRGLIAYLFVFGEFIDAYQSRTLPIHERIVMLARGMFFLDMWEKFLEAGQFSKAQHFISNEAKAIMHIIFSGFMEALYIYRDELGPEHPPFCPWLFGTDACEHIFGLCRQMVMDFRVVDFYYMTSKLSLGLRRLVSHRNTDSRATASGYNHAALFDTKNLNIHVLADYSQTSDAHIARWMRQGYAEASSLFEFLGLAVDEIYEVRAGSLPGFSTGVWDDMDASQGVVDKVEQDGLDDLSSESDIDSDSGIDSTEDWDSDLEMDEQDMRRARETLLRKFEANDLHLAAQKRVAQLTYAEAGLDAERKAIIDSYSDDDDEEDTVISEERSLISAVTHELRDSLVRRAAENIADSLPAVDAPVERTNPFAVLSQANSAVNMHTLVELRQRHETPEAAKASRTRTNYNQTKESDGVKKRAPTEYNKLMRAFAQVARDYKVPSDATGAQRKLRWTGKVTASGNSENAAKAANAVATKALHKRRAAFYNARAPELAQDAHINSLYHLRDELGVLQLRGSSATAGSCYGFVLFNGGIHLCKVLAIYRKTGGKNGKHGAVFVADREASPVSNICAVSNMAVQVFENVSHTAHVFRVVPSDLISLNIKRFTLLRSPQFLYALGGAVEPKGTRQVVLVSESDIHAFAELKGAVPSITRAVGELMKRGVGLNGAADGEDE